MVYVERESDNNKWKIERGRERKKETKVKYLSKKKQIYEKNIANNQPLTKRRRKKTTKNLNVNKRNHVLILFLFAWHNKESGMETLIKSWLKGKQNKTKQTKIIMDRYILILERKPFYK